MEPSFSGMIFPLALVLDLVIGDPHGLPHPIRWMGFAIRFFEPRFRSGSRRLGRSGLLFALFLILLTWGSTFLLVTVAGVVHPLLKTGIEIVLIYYCLSINSLQKAAREVGAALEANQLERARERLSLIVGRDVQGLGVSGVSRAAVETVAENFVDGVMSPLFFALIGGAPLCMAFKMVNTLDSMVGYKNETYIDFGKAAARIDDIANFIPGRLSVPVISLAAQLLGRRGWQTFRTALSEGKRHASPNSGWPEAAFSGALGIKLGGPNYYQGRLVEKPYIGVRFGEADGSRIEKACALMLLSSLLWSAVVWGIQLL
ncbi:MAG: adenosylcobinamide-phosphate synthase CbiB [Pseudomonadota bacterium]